MFFNRNFLSSVSFLLLFLVLHFFCINSTNSQTIQGTITHPLTGKGIPNIAVTIGDSSAVTDSLGHYVIHLAPPTDVKDSPSSGVFPRVFALGQNFPNPFNSQTIIEYQLPKSSYVQLTIFNVLGQKIRTLEDQEKQAGFFQTTWDGRNSFSEPVGSGIYFVQMTASKFVQTKKILLLR